MNPRTRNGFFKSCSCRRNFRKVQNGFQEQLQDFGIHALTSGSPLIHYSKLTSDMVSGCRSSFRNPGLPDDLWSRDRMSLFKIHRIRDLLLRGAVTPVVRGILAITAASVPAANETRIDLRRKRC